MHEIYYMMYIIDLCILYSQCGQDSGQKVEHCTYISPSPLNYIKFI